MERELPTGWVSAKLGEIADYINGKAFKPSEWSNEGLPIIRIQNLNNPKAEFNYCNFEVDEKFIVNTGDLLFAWSGTPGTSFGSHIWRGGKAVLNQHIFNIKFDTELLDKSFYNYALSSVLEGFINQAHGGAGLAHITKKKFENSFIPLAPLAEQKRIVAKLDEAFQHLDTLKTKLERIPELLKNFRQAVLTQAVTGKLTEDWREENAVGESAMTSIKRVALNRQAAYNKALLQAKKCKLPKPSKPNYLDYNIQEDVAATSELPCNWVVAKVGILCDCIVPGRDKPKSFTGDIPWITIPDINNRDEITNEDGKSKLSETEIKEVNARIIPVDSVIMSCVGRFGISSVVKNPVVINQQLHAFTSSELIASRYLMYHIRTLEPYLNSIATATTIAYLNKTNCNSLPINLPPFEEQKEIVKRIEALFAKADAIEGYYATLKEKVDKLPQAILAKAFRGELVPQDPNDEPASVLLEKIKAAKAGAVKSGNGKKAKGGKQGELVL